MITETEKVGVPAGTLEGMTEPPQQPPPLPPQCSADLGSAEQAAIAELVRRAGHRPSRPGGAFARWMKNSTAASHDGSRAGPASTNPHLNSDSPELPRDRQVRTVPIPLVARPITGPGP